MFADMIEIAVRREKELSPEGVRSLVRKLLMEMVSQNQLLDSRNHTWTKQFLYLRLGFLWNTWHPILRIHNGQKAFFDSFLAPF